MNIKFLLSVVLLVVVLMTIYPSCGLGPNDRYTVNPNIVKIMDCCSGFRGANYLMAVVDSDQNIYTIQPPTKIEINSSFEVLHEEQINAIPLGDGKPQSYIEKKNSRLLVVRSQFSDVSMGELAEVYLDQGQLITLKDSTYNVSSAVFWHGDENKLVYYSYGNEQGLEAGYYLYDKNSGKDSLLFPHRSPMGPSEMLNGFDLSPDDSKLLIPNVRASWDQIRSPQIIEFDLQTRQADTFDVAFELSFVRIGLWLRYRPDASSILYCSFPLGSLIETTNDDSEVGIIELPSRTKRVIDVNTNDLFGGQSVQIAPTWSEDGQHIIYGSAVYQTSNGAKGFYSLYVLKNVNDPRNYK